MSEKEDSDLIETAISQAMKSMEDYDPNDILVDWIVVAYAANPDKEKGGVYPTFYSNGGMPNYRAKGLLLQALIGEVGE